MFIIFFVIVGEVLDGYELSSKNTCAMLLFDHQDLSCKNNCNMEMVATESANDVTSFFIIFVDNGFLYQRLWTVDFSRQPYR